MLEFLLYRIQIGMVSTLGTVAEQILGRALEAKRQSELAAIQRQYYDYLRGEHDGVS